MLILVRHGETEANARGLLSGRVDSALSEKGRRQAARVAAALDRRDPETRVISSPLARTVATAEIIAGDVGKIEIDERWIELDYGELDGTALTAVPEETWARWRADPDFIPAGGESLRACGARVAEACTELLVDAAERDVVVVTHVSPIKAAAVWAMGVGDEVTWRLYVAPGSITRIGCRPHGPVLLSFNETR
ncbi:MAG: alpha-ribazole phosphatase [Acidimicrobiaceae bacterium]|jgi:broad specificity phosphatase PhoE